MVYLASIDTLAAQCQALLNCLALVVAWYPAILDHLVPLAVCCPAPLDVSFRCVSLCHKNCSKIWISWASRLSRYQCNNYWFIITICKKWLKWKMMKLTFEKINSVCLVIQLWKAGRKMEWLFSKFCNISFSCSINIFILPNRIN